MNDTMLLAASCAVGLERILSTELERLGAELVGRSSGRVQIRANDALIARILVRSRIADRLFLVAGRFAAADFDQLFEGAKNIEWERWIGKNDRLIIEKARSVRSKLAAQNSIQSVSLKASYERLCAHYGVATMAESANEHLARVRIEDDEATIELDLCGSPLSRRGYRKNPTEAPLKETVAAGLLFLSGWKRSYPLYDPFCGSGTIAIEAALYGLDIAPGLGRSFSWELMPSGSPALIQQAKDHARTLIQPERELLIAGSDADQAALQAAKANAGLAKLEDRVRFFRSRAEEAAPFAAQGYIITDPPYGKRLGSPEEADELYASMGSFVERFKAWQQCWIVDREELPLPGLKPAKCSKIVDGAETRYFHRFKLEGGPSDGPGERSTRGASPETASQGKTGPRR